MNKRNEKDEFNTGLKKTKLEENSFIEDVLENNDDNLFQPSDYYGELNEKEFNLNFSQLIKENTDIKPQDIKMSTNVIRSNNNSSPNNNNIPENNIGYYNNNLNNNMNMNMMNMNQMMSMQNNNMNMNMNMNTSTNNNTNLNSNMNQYNNQNFLNYMNNVNPQQYMNFFNQMNFMNNPNNIQPNNNNNINNNTNINSNNYPFHNFNQMGYGNNNNNINTSLSLNINNNNSSDSINNPVLEEIQNNEKQISQLFQAIDEQTSRLKEIRNNQEFFCKNLNRFTQENYFKIKEEQINLQKEFELVKDQLKNILKQYLLKTSTLCTIDEYKVTVDINIQQLLVYQSELDFVAKKIPEPKMIMMVQKQPYPCVVKQKEKMTTKTKNEDRLTICIVRGVTDNSIITEGSANLIFDSAKSIANNNIIEGTSTFIDGIAKFNNLRFSKGTGVKMARLNFKTQRKIQPNSKPVELESIPTENFIVITNEAQFGDSAMKLLKKYTFLKDEKTTWNFFANNLQMHYLSATRQKLSSVSRPLSMLDLSYIARTYFNENQFVMVDNFKEFWKWFGKILHKIRHQKPTLEMWNNGYIFGFITKKQAEEILGGMESGTFLIRFSERSPGQFAIDYVSKNKDIKHYLVPPTVKKLADHLREKESLKTIVVSKTDFEIFSVKDCYKGKTGKDGTLGKFYSNSSNESSNFPGYVESLEN